MEYTVADLKSARRELARLSSLAARKDDGQYEEATRLAAQQVEVISVALKAAGTLPSVEEDHFNCLLDRNFPHARNKQVVTFQGARYRKRVTPQSVVRNGQRATHWNVAWEKIA